MSEELELPSELTVPLDDSLRSDIIFGGGGYEHTATPFCMQDLIHCSYLSFTIDNQ
jgi:hypothetical protein